MFTGARGLFSAALPFDRFLGNARLPDPTESVFDMLNMQISIESSYVTWSAH